MTVRAPLSLPESLRQEAQRCSQVKLATLFEEETGRGEALSWTQGELFVDISRQRLSQRGLDQLLQVLEARGFTEWRAQCLRGEAINETEGRAVLHTALRCADYAADAHAQATAVREEMLAFATRFRAGELRGATGKVLDQVLHIGIGGSDLGPRMVTRALRDHASAPIHLRYVANVDGDDISEALAALDPERTLVCVASKTFTTLETMTNARVAKDWLKRSLGDELSAHLLALSTNVAEARRFGVKEDRVFGFWDWVGGRFSLWSAIGMPIALAIGPDAFLELLEGAASMDRHFAEAPLKRNLPVLLGSVEVWNRNLLGYESHAILPYDRRLQLLKDFLQQLEMESLGKGVCLNGEAVAGHSGPILWGGTGTDAQHAFFQLLHQGTTVVPADFLAVATPAHSLLEQHQSLLANFLAQIEALALGRDATQTAAALGSGDPLVAHKTFPGGRPTTALLMRELSPHALGELLALYEHKVLVAAAYWGINAFDQMGVELGKVLAKRAVTALSAETAPAAEAVVAELQAQLRHWLPRA